MKVNYNQDYFKTWSANMAYILGFYTGDGCITVRWKNKNGENGYRFSFGLNKKDINVLEFIRSEICPNANIQLNKQKQISGHISDMCRLNMDNQVICNDILNMGFKLRKTYNCSFPNIPEEFRPDYIRGYFDADGNASLKEKRARFFCIDGDFLNQLKEYTINIGSVYKGSSTYIWEIRKAIDIKNFIEYVYYNDNIFCLSRKREKLEDIKHKHIFIEAFNETKCINDWTKDSRCKITSKAIIYRIKKYSNLLSNEEIISLKSKELFNKIPNFIVLSPNKEIFKLNNLSRFIRNNKSMKFQKTLSFKAMQNRQSWSIRPIRYKNFEDWIVNMEVKTTRGKLSINDLKLMWDEELIKNAKTLDFTNLEEII